MLPFCSFFFFTVFHIGTVYGKRKYSNDFPFVFSAHSTPDQFSVKDSGKGDSEFNDSDSDISGEGLKKTPSQIMEKQLGKCKFNIRTPSLHHMEKDG